MPIRLTYIETRNVIIKGLKNITVTERNKGICQQPFCAIANYVVAGCLSVMKENDKFYWGIENWDGTDWEEITEELYNNLISFEEKRSKDAD